MSDLFPVTLAEQIACIEREIVMRKRVYPRLIEQRRMTEATSAREMRIIGAVLLTLQTIGNG